LSLAYLLEDAFTEVNPDSALLYAELIQQLAIKLRLRLEEIYAMGKIGYALQNKGNYARSLQTYLTAIALAEDPASETNVLSAHYPAPDEITSRSMPARIQRLDKLSHLHQYMAILYSNTQNPEKALESAYRAQELGIETQNQRLLCVIHLIMGRLFLVLNKPDSALLAEQRALEEAIRMDFPRYLGSIYLNTGRIHQYKGNRELAADFYRKALASSYDQNYFRGVVASNLLLAEYFNKDGNRDSSLFFINQALDMARQMDAPDLLLRTYQALANYYKPTVFTDSLVKYQGLIIRLNEDIFNIKQNQQFQNIGFDEQLRLQALEKEKEVLRNRNRTYGFTIGLGALLLIAFILYRNNRQKQKTNAALEKTLSELKATQAQLIG
jgi:tetratricopeptide (TPR) repeat protein